MVLLAHPVSRGLARVAPHSTPREAAYSVIATLSACIFEFQKISNSRLEVASSAPKVARPTSGEWRKAHSQIVPTLQSCPLRALMDARSLVRFPKSFACQKSRLDFGSR